MARLACRVQELESAAVAQQKEKENLAARGRASAAAAARLAAELAGARQAWRQREGEMDAQRKELQAHVGSFLCLLLIGLLRRFCCGTIFFWAAAARLCRALLRRSPPAAKTHNARPS